VLLGEEVDEEFASAKAFGDEDAEDVEAPVAGLDEDDEEADAEGWDMGENVDVEAESDFVNVEAAGAGAGSSEADSWARNSPIAADHVAAGSFETAMQLLNRQIGAVNFMPIQWRFEDIYTASRTFLPATPGLPPLVNYVRRNPNENNTRKVLPFITRDLESIATTDVVAGKTAMSKNKLEDGVKAFKKILHLLMINSVSLASEFDEAKRIIHLAAQYALAMSIELERRTLVKGSVDISSLPEDVRKRSLELSAYFTIPEVDKQHLTLTLYAAMNFAHKNKQLSSALSFANTLIERGTNAKFKESAKKIKTACERNPNDALEVEFDQFAEFDVCAASYTPIYSGSSSASCPFDGVKYQAKYKGTVCKICEVCEIGAPASGLRLHG